MRPLIPLHRRYERTCRECGYCWEVTPTVAATSGASVAFFAARDSSVRRTNRRGLGTAPDRATADALQGAVHALAICAQCGVENWDQAPLRRP